MSFALQVSDQAQLRQKKQQLLRSISESEIAQKSARLLENLVQVFQSHVFQSHSNAFGPRPEVGLFSPFKDEPQIQSFEESCAARNMAFSFSFPQTEGADMKFISPSGIEKFPEVFLVPGVVFHRSGARIGRGKGYYDRYLQAQSISQSTAKRRIFKIGLCFKEQLETQSWSENPHDQRVDMIVTDGEIVDCNPLQEME